MSGAGTLMESEFRSIADILPYHARRNGGKTAVATDAGDALSYAELDELSRRFAGFLRARNVAAGERVVILLQNVPEFVIAYFGAIAAGCIAVPANTRLSPAEVAYIVSNCAATVVVTNSERFGRVAGEEGARGVREWVLVDGGGGAPSRSGKRFRRLLCLPPSRRIRRTWPCCSTPRGPRGSRRGR